MCQWQCYLQQCWGCADVRFAHNPSSSSCYAQVDALVMVDSATVGGAGPRKRARLLPPSASGGTPVVAGIPLTQARAPSRPRLHLKLKRAAAGYRTVLALH